MADDRVLTRELTDNEKKLKEEKAESRRQLQKSAEADLGDLDINTGSDSVIGRWFAAKNRWTTSLVGLLLNIFVNIYVFVVLLNSCGDEYCCPSAFVWNGWTPSETFQLILGLVLVWLGMVGLGMLWWFATNGFRKGLGGLAIVCGYIMVSRPYHCTTTRALCLLAACPCFTRSEFMQVMGDLFLFMAYLSPSASESCVSDAPFYFDILGSFLPFLLVIVHAWWTISYTTLKDIMSELQDTRQLYAADSKAKKARDKAVKDRAKERQRELNQINSAARFVFKPFSALRTVMQAKPDQHQHPL